MLVVWKLPAADSPDDTAHFAVFDTCIDAFVEASGNQDWTRRRDFLGDVDDEKPFPDPHRKRLLRHAAEIPETEEHAKEEPPAEDLAPCNPTVLISAPPDSLTVSVLLDAHHQPIVEEALVASTAAFQAIKALSPNPKDTP